MRRGLLLGLCLFATVMFAALGIWQVQRLGWKRDLVARVEARLRAPLQPAPIAAGPADEYRRVRLTGIFRHDRATLVDALTERGPGFWVITPLVTPSATVLVNRGFVPPERKADHARPEGVVMITGLLRLSEPHGRILRPNLPEDERWYSRDVAAIARARSLGRVANYFIDAGATPAGSLPIGGLTVVKFRNAHLGYALTWFALAGLGAFGVWRLLRGRG